MSDSILRSILEFYEAFYLYYHGQKDSLEWWYKAFYPNLKDINRIPRDNKRLVEYIRDNEIDLVLVSPWMSKTLDRCGMPKFQENLIRIINLISSQD